ncbi:MAG: glycosyltransferase [Planctomycetes bacterium]|nr:glycosyltransferase [Planctomycetota bacterium]
MKIFHVLHNFLPEFEGGTEHVVRKLAAAQAVEGHAVTVVAGSDRPFQGKDCEEEDLDGQRVLRVRRTQDESYHIDFERPRLSRVLQELFERERPDVVHVHHWQTLPLDVARTAREAGAAVFITLHDFFSVCVRFFRISPDAEIVCPTGPEREPCVRCVLPQCGEPEERLLQRFARRDGWIRDELRAAHAVFAPSQTHAWALRDYLPAGCPEPQAAALGMLQEPPGHSPRRRASEDGVLRIATWGNQVPLKGLLVIVDALAQLPEPRTVELDVYGGFPDADLERMVDERVTAGGLVLRRHGTWPWREGLQGLARRMRSCDLAVFPSLCYESYGLVVDEALSLGLPVLVSDRGALAEVAGPAGIAVRSGDAEAWARMLRRLSVDRSTLDELAAAIPKRMRRIADLARDHLGHYREALSDRS